jgi:putative phosphoesterase
MKKYLICSDIHGCEPSFDKVIKYFNDNNFDIMLNLGDLLYHGPRNDLPEGYHPKGIIPRINQMKDKVIMVKGNCEAEVDQMVLDFHIFNSKKLRIGGKNVYLVHGHHLDKNNNNYKPGDIVFYGHTHVSKYEVINGVKYINPGSTSIPKEGTKKSFIILVDGKLELLDLDGNVLERWEF